MNNKVILKILLVMFLILAIFSLPLLYSVASQPDKYTSYSYYNYGKADGKYSYTLILNPNIIYGGEMIRDVDNAYRRVVRDIKITFSNSLVYLDPGDINVTYNGLIVLSSPSKWSKTIKIHRLDTSLKNTNLSTYSWTYDLNMTSLDNLIKKLDDETGSKSAMYTVKIIFNVNTVYVNDGKEYRDSFKPILVITINKLSDNGDIISFRRDYVNTQLRQENTNIVYNHQKKTYSYMYGGLTTLSFIGLGASLFIYNRKYELRFPGVKKKNIYKYIRENIDIIAQVSKNEMPEILNNKRVIRVRTAEDLIKISDILSEPILLNRSERGLELYVIDGEKAYTYGEYDDEKEK